MGGNGASVCACGARSCKPDDVVKVIVAGGKSTLVVAYGGRLSRPDRVGAATVALADACAYA